MISRKEVLSRMERFYESGVEVTPKRAWKWERCRGVLRYAGTTFEATAGDAKGAADEIHRMIQRSLAGV